MRSAAISESRMSAAPLLEVRRLRVDYAATAGSPWAPVSVLRALDGVDFNLGAGESLGIVGESGCGKSTLARTLVGLQPATAGSIRYRGTELCGLDDRAWRPLRRDIQMVFQDPLSSLNPRMTISESVAEPLQALYPELGRDTVAARACAMLERVGLSRALHARYPHEFSGGQCQRVGIARALVVEPALLICDEPVSALDVSIQAGIINLLADLRAASGLALLFIAHDLAVVRHISQRVLVMYRGRLMEQAPAERLFAQPAHPYTQALMAAAADRGGRSRLDAATSDVVPAAGCHYAPRCVMADEQCTRQRPAMRTLPGGNSAACHYPRICA